MKNNKDTRSPEKTQGSRNYKKKLNREERQKERKKRIEIYKQPPAEAPALWALVCECVSTGRIAAISIEGAMK